MLIKSTRFGEIEVAEELIINFTNGIPGFPQETSFAFLAQGPDSPFFFIQSVSNPDLTFILIEPFTFLPDYTFKLEDEIVSGLQLSDKNLPQVFNIVSVRDNIESATVNLIAPIIVNWQAKIASQIILEKTSYTTRQRLFPDGLPGKKAAEGGR